MINDAKEKIESNDDFVIESSFDIKTVADTEVAWESNDEYQAMEYLMNIHPEDSEYTIYQRLDAADRDSIIDDDD